mgnify:CR=1 FL=1
MERVGGSAFKVDIERKREAIPEQSHNYRYKQIHTDQSELLVGLSGG